MKPPRYYQVEKNPSLVRDMESSAILNKDVDAFNAYKKERAYRLKIKKMTEEFEGVKSDISYIKNLLEKLLDK